jgi:hypothetical protein
MALALGSLAVSCQDAQSPTSSLDAGDDIIQLSATSGSGTTTSEVTVFKSGSHVIAWDPILPATSYGSNWPTTVCTAAPQVGLDANWVNPHNAFSFSAVHPFESWYPSWNFDAEWINAYRNGPYPGWSSLGPDGHNWTKYSTQVSGNGNFVVQFLADNCSWIYIDGELIGYQGTNFSANQSGRYAVTLDGEHELSFIIFDGGGAAGGKFRLETRQSFIDNGGDTGVVVGPSNTAPVADAGADQSVAATGATTAVTLNGSGSTDADNDELTYSWTLNGGVISTTMSPTLNLADGSYTFTLTVSDGEASDVDEVTVSVVNTIPVARAGADQTKEATGPNTSATLNGSASTDADGDALMYSWSLNGSVVSTSANPTVSLGLGAHTFTLTVSDAQGASDTDEVTVRITDTTAPSISFTSVTTQLWPPNHKMVLVARNISATDIVNGSTSVSIMVSSNEPANGRGDGNTNSDSQVVANPNGTYDVYVRSERTGSNAGRVYTINMTSTDASGNTSSRSMTATVAPNQSARAR